MLGRDGLLGGAVLELAGAGGAQVPSCLRCTVESRISRVSLHCVWRSLSTLIDEYSQQSILSRGRTG